MVQQSYEAIVIGAGPAGYVTAIRLGQLGVETLCVEKEHWGGVCLNWGCIPSKALIAAAGLAHRVAHASAIGLEVESVTVDVARMQRWKDAIVRKLTTNVKRLVLSNGVDLAFGSATLVSENEVEVIGEDGSERVYSASEAIVVATGARVADIPGFEPDGETIIDARTAVSLQEAPESMLIIGGGVIGMELGMVYQKLGTKLTVVERTDQLLPGVDEDVVRVVRKRFTGGANPAEVLTGTTARSCEVKAGGAEVVVETGDGSAKVFEVEKVLVCVGFEPRSGGLALETAGVTLDDRGHVTVDDTLRTNVPGIYAIGDVTGPPYLAHKASKEGEVAAAVIAGQAGARMDVVAMPAAIFTDPEIATVGMTEAEAQKRGKTVKVGKFPFAVSGRAMTCDEADGFIKVLTDPQADHAVLGVTVVGPKASDLIGEGALAMAMHAHAEDVALTVHPHPTLGEGVMEAFKAALGEAVQTMNRR